MKRLNTQRSSFGILGQAVLTATLLGCVGTSHLVSAAPVQDASTAGVYVTILSPTLDATDPNKQVEISAFYQAGPVTGGITELDLFIDGQQEAVKKLDSPENRGVVSFVISPGTLAAGSHHIVVRVSASDAEVASAKTMLNITQPIDTSTSPAPALGGDTADGSAPAVAIMAPAPDSTVVGTVDIKVDAHDDSGKSPYVSLFIDHNFKTLRNFPPYDFAWDTTRVANGYHTLEVWGYNDDQAVGHAQPLTVYVNNPSGRTMVRQDLLDTVPAKFTAKAITKAAAIVAKPHALPRASAKLAYGTVAVAGRSNELAVAKVDVSASSLSEQSMLMAPFLPKELPQIQHHALPLTVHAAPIVYQTPSLASQIAPTQLASSTQLAQIESEATSVEPETFLTAPQVSLPIVRKHAAPVQQPMKAAPAVASEVIIQQPAATLVNIPAAVATDDQNVPSLEAPAVTEVQVKLSAALASGKPARNIMLGATKMASANVDGSTLFTPNADLLEPALQHAANIISTHRVLTHLLPLGTTASGFSPRTILTRDGAYRVVMNNRLVVLDQPLADRDSFLFAPFRQIFENEGGVMAWNPTSHEVHALSADRDIHLTIGSRTALVNQEEVTLNACPYLVRGHTMIPLAFVPIALDATVNYDPSSGHIVINSRN